MLVYGHRGVRIPGASPENTPQAVAQALAGGAAGVEVDVRRAPDGTLRCRHDPLPADLSGVPLIGDVIRAGAGARVIVEVKNAPHEPGFEPPGALLTLDWLVDLLSADDDVVVSSFDFAVVAAAAARGLVAGHLLLPGVALRAGVAWALEHGAHEVHPPVATVLADPQAVNLAREAGLRVVPWTVKTLDEAWALIDAGVDAAICDDPASVVRGLDERGGHEHPQGLRS
jgi:glycerophosphoryl diester phosphodiesterase